jgi:uncharacterized integral membrane protein (TIGR00697 family)
MTHWHTKKVRLFLILTAVFIANALVAELIGVKIFSFEKTAGITPFEFNLLGEGPFGWNLSAGVLMWPIVFISTDIINEYYGKKGVKFLSYLAVGIIAYAFVMVYGAILLVPADFWVQKNTAKGLVDMQQAFAQIFGQSLWIIIGSICAFFSSQLIDVYIFQKIKRATGEKNIWLRATGSTLISQFIDSFVVLFIAFKIGQGWTLPLVMSVCLVQYAYKFMMAILLTPAVYAVHYIIEQYLGKNLAQTMRQEATATM